MATASTPALADRVLRLATSHVRALPTWSTYSIFWRVTHFASDVGSSERRVMTGSWVFCVMVRGRVPGEMMRSADGGETGERFRERVWMTPRAGRRERTWRMCGLSMGSEIGIVRAANWYLDECSPHKGWLWTMRSKLNDRLNGQLHAMVDDVDVER